MQKCDRCAKGLPRNSVTGLSDANHFRVKSGNPKPDKTPTVSVCPACASGLVESLKSARESLRPACDCCGGELPVSASTSGEGLTVLKVSSGVLSKWGVEEVRVCSPCASDTVKAYEPAKPPAPAGRAEGEPSLAPL